MNMELPHLKNLIDADISENQNKYAEFNFGIPDQFMICDIDYLFSGAYIPDAVDVVITATGDALRTKVSIVQNVNGKVVVISHVPAITKPKQPR